MLQPNSQSQEQPVSFSPRRHLAFYLSSISGKLNTLLNYVEPSGKPNIHTYFNYTYSVLPQHGDCLLEKKNKCDLSSHN